MGYIYVGEGPGRCLCGEFGLFLPSACLAKHGQPLHRLQRMRKGTLDAEGQGLINSCCTQRPAIRAC